MLQSIRDRTQGWIAGVIISLLILSFALWGIHSYFTGSSSSLTVAEVNGVEITKSQLAVAYERLQRQMQSQSSSDPSFPVGADAALKDRALQSLVNVEVLKQASLKQHYWIGRNQVDSFLENMPEFQINGQFSIAKFQQVLSTTMYTPSEFLELIKTSLLIDQPRLGIIFTSFYLPNEVNETIALVNQERDIQFVILPTQFFVNQIDTIPDSAVQSYYAAHQNEFKIPDKLAIEYIELSVHDFHSAVQASASDLKNFYNENSNAFAAPAQWKLEKIIVPLLANATDEETLAATNKANDIYNKAKEGIDFSALARHYSIKMNTEWVAQSQVPADLQKTFSLLTKPNQVSTPVQTADGIVVLKVLDFKEPELMPFDKVKEKVNEAYAVQKAEEKFINAREKLASLTYEHPDSLQPAAQELGLSIKTSEWFTREKGNKDITDMSKVREIAFSNEVLNLQNNSDVIQKSPDFVTVIRVKSHLPSTLLSLKVVQEQIIDKLKIAAVDTKTLDVANQIKQDLSSGNASEALNQYRLAWNNAGFILRHSTKVDQGILDVAFEMPVVADKITYSVAKVPNGYAIIALKAVKNGKLTTDDEFDVYAEQIQNAEGLLEYELYKESMTQASKIINQ